MSGRKRARTITGIAALVQTGVIVFVLVVFAITHPHAELAARFRHLILGLCAVVISYIAKDLSAGPLVGAIYMRLRRCSLRFDGVLARIGAVVLPRRPRPAGAGAARMRAPSLLPRRRGWLVELLKHEAAAYGGYDGRLGYLLRDPAMVALLAASPQVGRVLRPVWRMLSTDKLPAVLRPPPPSKPGKAADDPAPIEAAPGTVAQSDRTDGEAAGVARSESGHLLGH